MPIVDLDALIRDRAYALWEEAGRPCGHEHQHWAAAREEIEAAHLRVAGEVSDRSVIEPTEPRSAKPIEVIRLREALYAPEPFSFALYGLECPPIDCPVVLRLTEEHRAAA